MRGMRDTLNMSATKQRFDEIIQALRDLGWGNLRIDTLVHPTHDGAERHQRPTIRYGYVAGEWTVALEPDRNWQKPHPDAEAHAKPWQGVEFRLVANRELPEVDQVLAAFAWALGFGPESPAVPEGTR